MVGVELSIVAQRVHDEQEVGVNREGPGSHHHLNGPAVKETLHQPPVPWAQTLVHVCHPLAEGLTQGLVLDLGQEGGNVLSLGVQEPVGLTVTDSKGE